MASKTGKRATKGRNGTGDSVTLYFDRSDPAERRALEAARLLAAKHGRRKQAIVALLEAVYSHYEATGELMSASAITSALMVGQGGVVPERAALGFTSAVARAHGIALDVDSRLPRARGGVTVADGAKASAETVAKNFLSSMKGLANGFFD